MGWGSGAYVADDVWSAIVKHVKMDAVTERKLATALIKVFERHDCDTMCETTIWEVAHEKDQVGG